MKSKLRFLCFVMIFLFAACSIVYVHAASETSPCTSYSRAYQSAFAAYNAALLAVQRAEVLYLEALPGSYPIPSNLKHLQEEYKSNPEAFIKKWKDGVSVHRNIPGPLGKLLEVLNPIASLSDTAALIQARTDTNAAYASAVTTLEAAEKALEECQGVTIVTIYCERGANCQNLPGVQGNPKAHYVFKCPNYIRVGAKLPLLAKACPGTWWSCEGVGQCPKRWSHLSSDEVAESKIVVSDTTTDTTTSKLACGIHNVGTPGDHSLQASCQTDTKCISTNFYQCLHTKHELKLLECGHEKGSPGSHVKSYWRACGHTDWHCLGAKGHNYNRCPKDTDGQICTGNAKYPGYYLPCDTSHDHQYPTAADKIKRGACGHVYDHGSSSAYSHRQVDCPTQNGVSCSYSFYYACRGEHAHAYTSDPDPPVTPDPKPDPDPPVTPDPKPDPKPVSVKCANRWRGAGKCSYNRVVSGSDAYEHQTKCKAGHTYWSCNVTAVSSHSGHKSKTPTTPTTPKTPTSPTQPKPPPVSVSYHACGVHSTTTSGDHSLQASCSRDSRCIAQSFYYCQHGSHTYPSVPKPKPPPKPPTVKCPANSWTNCGGTSSHATTCPAGDTYYTCNPAAVKAHSGHKKPSPKPPPKPPTVKCPANSWTNCGGTSSHATTCGLGHTYYTCNPSAVSSHSGHSAGCPASQWTRCGGSSSHAKTCGRGHKYYTCNPAARRAHGWH